MTQTLGHRSLFKENLLKCSLPFEIGGLGSRLYCRMKKTILIATVLLGAVYASQAGVHVGLGFSIPLASPPVVVSPPPVVYQAPAPVYTAPAPVYTAPAPVCQASPPVVYAPPPIVYAPPPPPVVYAPPAPSIYLGFGTVWGGHYSHYGHYRGWGGSGHHGWHR